MGVKERRLREFQRREEEILAAAYHLLTRLEPGQMTMEMIAEKAEIGRGTTYKHFKSKDEIFARLLLTRRELFLRQLRAITPVKDGMQRLIRVYMDYCLEDPTAYRIHKGCENQMNRQNLSAVVITSLQEQQEEKLRLVKDILQRSLGDHVSDSHSLYFICAGWGMLRGAIDAMMEDRFEGAQLDKEEYYQVVQKMLMSGLPSAVELNKN